MRTIVRLCTCFIIHILSSLFKTSKNIFFDRHTPHLNVRSAISFN